MQHERMKKIDTIENAKNRLLIEILFPPLTTAETSRAPDVYGRAEDK
jgi:hypothetical protein